MADDAAGALAPRAAPAFPPIGAADDPTLEWARIQWKRASLTPGAWYDARLADAVIAAWPRLFKLTVDRFAGVPFRLLPWQELVVRMLVGWRRPIVETDPATGQPRTYHVRLFRRLRLWVPRKNGKTEFLAALALLFFVYDGVQGGEGYCFARGEKQGNLALKRMKAMIASSSTWGNQVNVFKKSFYVASLGSGFELMTGADEGKQGLSATVWVGDEMAEWRSRDIEGALEESTGARLEPIGLYASTAGLSTNRIGVEIFEECQAILDGRIPDPSSLVVIYNSDPEEDIFDPATWRKANPGLGLSPSLAFMEAEAIKAKISPRAQARFRCYHLNQFIEAEVRWLPLTIWDKAAAKADGWKRYRQTLMGRTAFAAFDISSTRDLTALILVFPPNDDDPKWRVLPRFWVPEEGLAERIAAQRGSAKFDLWSKLEDDAGLPLVETTPGNFVDQNFLRRGILDACQDYDVQLIGFDPWNARKLYTDLTTIDGLEADRFVEMRQGIPTLGEPSKALERLVFEGALDHGGHPVLRWMAGNTVVRFDENLNFMPAKKRSAEKIDGIVATVMAVGLALNGEDAMDLGDFLASPVMAA